MADFQLAVTADGGATWTTPEWLQDALGPVANAWDILWPQALALSLLWPTMSFRFTDTDSGPEPTVFYMHRGLIVGTDYSQNPLYRPGFY